MTKGVIQVGIWVVPSRKWGFVRYVLTASMAIRVNTQMLLRLLVHVFPFLVLNNIPSPKNRCIHTQNASFDKSV